MSVNTKELDEIARRNNFSVEDIYDIVQRGISDGRIITPTYQERTEVLAGGTNFCPNSDFAWSQMAATTQNVLPSTSGDTNYEIHRVFRQKHGTAINVAPSVRVRSVGHGSYAANEAVNTYIPIWDRVNGIVQLGSTNASELWDIAFALPSNQLQNNRDRYVRVAVASDDDAPLPEGLRLFAGYWARRTNGTQGWVSGSNFTVSYRLHSPPGPRKLQYKVVARSDAGNSLGSEILEVNDAPAVLDADNYIELSYTQAVGLTQFLVYRKDVATGRVDLIAEERNSTQLWAYDSGQSLRFIGTEFPSSDRTDDRAYAEVRLDVLPFSRQLTWHNLRLKVPSAFDTEGVVEMFLRMGLAGVTAHPRQIILDTIWESESFNVWSPSVYDANYPSPRSTTLATAPPSGGGGIGIGNGATLPGIGSGTSCVWTEHDVMLAGGEWRKMGELTLADPIDNGIGENRVKGFIQADVTQFYRLEFEHGLVIKATASHRFARSLEDYSGVLTTALEPGDTILGGDHDGMRPVQLIAKVLETGTERIPVRTISFENLSENRLYRVGERASGRFVFSHNSIKEVSSTLLQSSPEV